MPNRMTSQLPEDRAWRVEQMDRSNDIESLTPLTAEDEAFSRTLFAADLTDEQRVSEVLKYIQTHIAGTGDGHRLSKAS